MRDAWMGHLNAAVMALRVGMEAKGSQELARWVEALDARLLASLPPAAVEALAGWLAEAEAAQGRGDFIYVADLLQFEVGPLFGERFTLA